VANQSVHDAFKKFQDTENKNMRRQRNKKWTQRGMQQTPKWNNGHNKKKEIGDSKMATWGRKQKAWGDAGDTPYRKNHWEEAKPQLLLTPSPHIVSPLHIKLRNQEGSHTARHQLLPTWETQTTRWAKRHVVFPQTAVGQISIVPWTDWPPPREKKRRKLKLNNKQQQQQKTRSKEGRAPWAPKAGRGNPSQNCK
jgi:hypothetical protein